VEYLGASGAQIVITDALVAAITRTAAFTAPPRVATVLARPRDPVPARPAPGLAVAAEPR
jgi:hypothetical protein